MKSFLKAAAFVVGMLGAGSALAQSALVTTDLNLRAGPGTNYQSVGVLPNGAVVNIAGCTSGYSWCRVNYQGYDGWASSRFLAQQEGRYAGGGNFSSSAASIGIPLIAGVVIGSALSNNDRDYRRYDRYDRRDWRADRRDWRREARRDWRDDRRDDRRDWRNDRRGSDTIRRLRSNEPFRFQTD